MKGFAKFWNELKRRNVVRVVTVYAASAFVILELVDIIAEPLKLPEWLLSVVIVLLSIGLIISIILSWIYDIHPEGGVVKTEAAKKVRAEDIPKSSQSWKIASYISFAIIAGLILTHVFSRNSGNGNNEILDKSIAVLPFRNDSPDEEKMYFINGTMEAILDNLCKIEDLKVPGRTSVEQYRDLAKPIPLIAEELNVDYILEGSGQKLGSRILLTVQLLDGVNDHHIWSKQYDREIQKVEDLIDIQSEIAQLVAAEIKVIITPEEKELIAAVPTSNLTAYNFYQRGREEFNQFYWGRRTDRELLQNAENLFHKALNYDSTFALAYTGLAFVHLYKHYEETFLSEQFLDSALIFANIAQNFDTQISDTYLIKGIYFSEKGRHNQAFEEYNQALQYNPNSWWAYSERASLYDLSDDLLGAIKDLHKAVSLNHGSEFPVLLRSLSSNYTRAGIFEKARSYLWEAFQLDNDSARYYLSLAFIEEFNYHFEDAIRFQEKAFKLDSSRLNRYNLLWHAKYYLYLDKYEESLEFIKEALKKPLPADGSWDRKTWAGYAYLKNGFKEEAESYFNEQISHHNRMIELDRESANMYWTYYDAAAVYAMKGETELAISNLNSFNLRPRMCGREVISIKYDPMFDGIRDEPEFQRVVTDIEVKYQAEHERIRMWLEENDML